MQDRSPFPDHRIIEFAFGIPADMKIRVCNLNWTIRKEVGMV
jgi:hypothetical protein